MLLKILSETQRQCRICVTDMRRLQIRLRSHRWVAAIEALIVIGVVVLLAGAVLALNFWLTDASRSATDPTDISRVRDVVGIVQAFVWAFLIVAGGIFAYRKLQLFRDFEPHLTITQAVTHRPVGTQYVHIGVIVTLHNSSKVKVEVRDFFFRMHQISPLSDEGVVNLYVNAFRSEDHSDIDWPVMENVSKGLGRKELVIEPGEYHHEPFEFIVSEEVESVLIYSYFYNLKYSQHSQSAQGWAATTFYDILKSVSDERTEEVHDAISPQED